MKVFAVVAGTHYHGEDVDTLKVFVNKKDARAYGKELEQWNDYVEIVESVVEGVYS